MKRRRMGTVDILLELAVEIAVFVIYFLLFRFPFDAPQWAALVGATIMQRVSLVRAKP